MDNPWLNISWEKPIADIDRKRIDERYGSIDAFERSFENFGLKIQNALPEPYSGNKDSKVYCLNMNPGKWNDNFYNNESMIEMTLKNLKHEVDDCLWWKKVQDVDGNKHDGYKWTKKRIKGIEDILDGQRVPSVFFLEYFPYHSCKGFDFPHYLPSYDYNDKLIMEAMEQDKWFVIMRNKRLWYNRIPKLECYSRKLELVSPIGGWLSPRNFKQCGNEDFLKEIF